MKKQWKPTEQQLVQARKEIEREKKLGIGIYGCGKRKKKKLKQKLRKRKKPKGLLASLGFKTYHHYLKSDLWREIRQQVLSKSPFCVACGIPANVVHHMNYRKKTLLGEDLESLVPLCQECHEYIEFYNDGTKRPLKNANRVLEKISC